MFAGTRRTNVAIVGILPSADGVEEPPERALSFTQRLWSGLSSSSSGHERHRREPLELSAGTGTSSSSASGAGGSRPSGVPAAQPQAGELQAGSSVPTPTTAGSGAGPGPSIPGGESSNSQRDAEDTRVASVGAGAEAVGAEAVEEGGERGPPRGRLDRVLRALGLRGGDYARPQYPLRFKALIAVVVGLSLLWLGNYIFVVLAEIDQYTGECRYNDKQLRYNAKILFVYFAWFISARLLLFVPCVAERVIWVLSRTHGFCHAYCVHLLLRDGPLYIFVMGSLLFWFHLMQSSVCEENSPDFYRALKLYAIYSNLVSVFCLILAHWHNRLLAEAAGLTAGGEMRQSAPPDTVHKLETHPYDEAVFGDEDGKLYPSECAICLAVWTPEDVIKVTPCGHAFHEQCIGSWLQTARTCALCRQDLAAMTAVAPPIDLRQGGASMAPQAEVVGSPTDAGEQREVAPDEGGGDSRPLPGSPAVEDV